MTSNKFRENAIRRHWMGSEFTLVLAASRELAQTSAGSPCSTCGLDCSCTQELELDWMRIKEIPFRHWSLWWQREWPACWRPKLTWLGVPVCIDWSDRSRWLCQNSDLTSPLRSSRRDDQNAYMERPIWTSDERVMAPGRIDSDPDWSDRLAGAVRPIRTAQSELEVIFWHEIN